MNVESPFCGNCGTRLRPDAKFCHRCGVDFKLFKSSPAGAQPDKPVRDSRKFTAITEERINSLSDQNLRVALEKEIEWDKGKATADLAQNANQGSTTKFSHPQSRHKLPTRAVVLIIALISTAFLGIVGVTAWSYRGLLTGRKFNSSLPPKAVQTTKEPTYFQTYDVTLTTKTKFADRATGSPDARFAVIAPGGKLVLRVMEPFSDIQGTDIQVIRKEGNARYRVACWNLDSNKWQRLDSTNGDGEFDMGRYQVHKSNQIEIENLGSEPLLIDAVRINR